MNDSRYDAALKLYDLKNELQKLRDEIGKDATGFTQDLSTFARDTLTHQLNILDGVADTINSLSNLMYEAQKGRLVVMKSDNRGGRFASATLSDASLCEDC